MKSIDKLYIHVKYDTNHTLTSLSIRIKNQSKNTTMSQSETESKCWKFDVCLIFATDIKGAAWENRVQKITRLSIQKRAQTVPSWEKLNRFI